MRWEHHSFLIPSSHCFRQCWCFAYFEVTLKFGSCSISGGVFAWKPHFAVSILWITERCQVALTVELATLSGIIWKSCSFHCVGFHRPWWCFCLSNQDWKLGENHRQEWSLRGSFFLAEIAGLQQKENVPVFVFHHIVSVEKKMPADATETLEF